MKMPLSFGSQSQGNTQELGCRRRLVVSESAAKECTKNREQRADAMNRNFGLAMAQAA